MPADRRRQTKSCCLVCRSPAADSQTANQHSSHLKTFSLWMKSNKWWIYWINQNDSYKPLVWILWIWTLNRVMASSKSSSYKYNKSFKPKSCIMLMMWQMNVPSDNKPAAHLEPDQRSDWPGNICLLQPWFLKTPERFPYSPTASDAPANNNDIHSLRHVELILRSLELVVCVKDLCDLLRLSEFLLPGHCHLLNELLRLLQFFLKFWSFKRLTNPTQFYSDML